MRARARVQACERVRVRVCARVCVRACADECLCVFVSALCVCVCVCVCTFLGLRDVVGMVCVVWWSGDDLRCVA